MNINKYKYNIKLKANKKYHFLQNQNRFNLACNIKDLLNKSLLPKVDSRDYSSEPSFKETKDLKAYILSQLLYDEEGKCTNAFRLISDEDILTQAYLHIKSKPGNMTPGSNTETLDGIDLPWFKNTNLSLIRDSYVPKPARRVYIPKKNGKLRPLGIGSPRDKIVQQAMLFVLETVLEPKFLNTSHGFRPNRSCHTALREIRNWAGCSWFIEGDIKGFFDNINHNILAKHLGNHFNETRFLNLYWKFVKAGYVEWDNRKKKSISSDLGVPQGSIISPILSNLYLHELDEFLKKKIDLFSSLNKNISPLSVKNPIYNALTLKISRRYGKILQLKTDPVKHGPEILKLRKEIRPLLKLRLKIKSYIPNAKLSPHINYVRYADDWLIGIWGPRSLAANIKMEIQNFLSSELELELSMEKTLITNTRTGRAKFLGVYIKRNVSNKVTFFKRDMGMNHSRRIRTSGSLVMMMPTHSIINKLIDEGFVKVVNGSWRSISIPHLIPLNPKDIVLRYKSVLSGYKNYFNFVDNKYDLRKIHWLLKESLKSTLCRKWDISKNKLIKKIGRDLNFHYSTNKGAKIINFAKPDLKWSPMQFLIRPSSVDPTNAIKWQIHSVKPLESSCASCNSQVKVEMHHLKHIKTINVKLNSFDQNMAKINRKQIPLCHNCHQLVHKGQYSGLSLNFLSGSNK